MQPEEIGGHLEQERLPLPVAAPLGPPPNHRVDACPTALRGSIPRWKRALVRRSGSLAPPSALLPWG
eukprot:15438104-Alexandrium_andersonii.AAC.1